MKLAPRHAIAALVAVSALVALAGGCTRQSEGQRCSTTNGNEDCDGSLVCTEAADLQGGDDDVARCCPPVGDGFSDSRCAPRVGGGGGTGGGNTGLGGANNGGGGQGGAATGGQQGRDEPCNYTSECVAGFVCGPGGQCQPECRDDVDCPPERPTCSSAAVCIATP